MVGDTKARFDAGARAWADYNWEPLGRIRREVTWHNLASHLPDVAVSDGPGRMLDAGGGSGELALRLIRRGFHVWLLDYAPAMLAQAREEAQRLPDEVYSRLHLCEMTVDEAPRSFAAGFFDAITCHTLIEYLPDPKFTLGTLTGLLGKDGLLSVCFVNRHATLFRRVWSQADPGGALAGLENGTFCATLFDVPGTAYTAEEVSSWLAELGLTVVATCGVRVFADYVPRKQLDDPEFFDSLLRLEMAVADRFPYLLLARYSHLLAQKRAGPGSRWNDLASAAPERTLT